MSKPKEDVTRPEQATEGETEPGSRVRIKSQPADRQTVARAMSDMFHEATREAREELITRSRAEGWTREQIVDRLIALELGSMTAFMSQEDRDAIAAVAREVFLADDQWR